MTPTSALKQAPRYTTLCATLYIVIKTGIFRRLYLAISDASLLAFRICGFCLLSLGVTSLSTPSYADSLTPIKSRDRLAFSRPYSQLKGVDKLNFRLGQAIFEKIWVSSPSSTTASDGLGPYYNARSCLQCHPRNGRGQGAFAQNTEALATSMATVFHLSLESTVNSTIVADSSNTTGSTAAIPEPNYGFQLQGAAIANLPAEAKASVSHTAMPVTLADGLVVELQQPQYHFSHFGQGPFAKGTRFSPRLAPSVFGLGVIARIADDDILAWADPNDQDQNGISGKANWALNQQTNKLQLGRFGLKAAHPTITQQNATALHNDLGLSSELKPTASGDCTPRQTRCFDPRFDGTTNHPFEVPTELTDLLDHYILHLKAPLPRNNPSEQVLAGKKIFYDIGCQQCHRSQYPSLSSLDPRRVGAIEPYTDLLLHDMGPLLADQRRDLSAAGQEWRTPPLWGIGLTKQVLGYENYLHDGRARSILEAILWHGGEAKTHQQNVIALPTAQRHALIAFLESL